jgi:hypothetical protein
MWRSAHATQRRCARAPQTTLRGPAASRQAAHVAVLNRVGGGVAGTLARFAGRRAAGALRFAGGRARVVAPARVRTIFLVSLSKPSCLRAESVC